MFSEQFKHFVENCRCDQGGPKRSPEGEDLNLWLLDLCPGHEIVKQNKAKERTVHTQTWVQELEKWLA
jgi:hypothetical protein